MEDGETWLLSCLHMILIVQVSDNLHEYTYVVDSPMPTVYPVWSRLSFLNS